MTAEQALGWALVHFLWQGAGLALLAYIGLRVIKRSQARYAWAVGVMGLMALAPVATFTALWRDRAVLDVPLVFSSVQGSSAAGTLGVGNPDWIRLAVKAWAVGALLLLARSAGGWWLARRDTRLGLEGLASEWIERVERLKARLGISRAVDVFGSTVAETPQVFGWVQPVLLLPACMLTGMTPEQVEALIAHELAHVRRHDYLVNLLQRVVESLLFYHPAVWWISRRIRDERESCCDEVAVEACGDRVLYSAALLRLEETRVGFAMAASGSRLRERIGRLLGMEQTNIGIAPVVTIGAAALLCATLIWGQETKKAPAAPAPAASPSAVQEASARARDRELEAVRAEVLQLQNELQKTRMELELTRQKLVQQSATLPDQKRAQEQALKEYERALKEMQQGISDLERSKAEFEVQARLAEVYAQKAQQQKQEQEKELQRRITYADNKFKEPDVRGSETDRGRVYVKFGPPDELEVYPGKGEAWRYAKEGTIYKFDAAGKQIKE